MKGVLKKSMADLRRRKLQAAIVTIVVLLSSLAGTLAVSLLLEADAPFDHAFNQASGAHLLVRYDASRVSSAQIQATAHLPVISAAGGPWSETGLEVTAASGSRIGLGLLSRADPGGAVDRLTLVSGRWMRRVGEVVIARRGQKMLGAQIGEMLRVTPGQDIATLRVVGVAAAVNDFSDGWLMPQQVAAVRPTAPGGNVGRRPASALMFYRLRAAATRAEIESATKQITAAVPPASALSVNNWLDQKRNADTTTAVMIPFLLAFSAFALMAAAMIIGNVVSGAVIADYREIGIMKSVGFTPLQVVATLAIQMLVPAILGALVGIAGGVAASTPFLVQTAAAFDLPAEPALVPLVLAGCLAAALAVVLLAAVVPATRAGRMSAAEAISSGSAPRGGGGRRAGRTFARLPLPRALSLGMTDAIARPVRSSMTLAAVAIGVATITFAVGLTRSLTMVKHSLTHDLTVQATLERHAPEGKGASGNGLTDGQAVALIQAQPGTSRLVAEGLLQVHVDGLGQPARLFGYRGDARWVGYELVSGRWFAAPREAVAPQALLNATGKAVGDAVTVSLEGRPESLKIVGVAFDTNGDNLLLRADWSAMTQLSPGLTPQTYDIQLAAGTDPRHYRRQLMTSSGDPGLDLRIAGDSSTDQTFLLIESVLGGLATVLTLIAMAGVFNTVVLNTREKARDTAILKALGMTPRQVVVMVLVSIAMIGVAGAAVGVPAGQLLHRQVLTLMGQIAASTPVPSRFYAVFPLGLLMLLAGTGVLVGAVAAWLPATFAARSSVSPLLTSE